MDILAKTHLKGKYGYGDAKAFPQTIHVLCGIIQIYDGYVKDFESNYRDN